MKVKELVEMLLEEDQEVEVRVITWDGCAGPDGYYEPSGYLEEDFGSENGVALVAQKGCMCVSRKSNLKLPEVIQENTEMKKAFFKLRKDAFLSRLDRWEVLTTAVKFVGNQPNGKD